MYGSICMGVVTKTVEREERREVKEVRKVNGRNDFEWKGQGGKG
jgi:hypothetical protein